MRVLLTMILSLFCTLSFSQLQFDNVASAVGANYGYGSSSIFGGGVSFVDFNGDGWDDLTLTTDDTKELVFLRNDNGVFTRIFIDGITTDFRAKHALWVDYDNDGDKDFFVTNLEGGNVLYNNDGNFQFTDVTASSGLFTTNLESFGATFGDIDNDGDLDLFIANRNNSNSRNYLYRNDNGLFVDVTAAQGISTAAYLTFLGSFFDYDNDGDQDLYLINDKSDANVLYQNDGTGQFTDVSTATGTGIVIDAMSCTLGDFNADGWVDIYITNTEAGNYLLQNNNGTFSNVAASAEVEFNSVAWGATFLDADLDTHLDLYVSSSMDGSIPIFPSAAFYHNQGDDTYTIPNDIGFNDDTRSSYANAIGDFNNDGKPDIVVMNENADYFLWENQTNTTNNWIKIKLEGTVSNKEGIGNKIEIHANGTSQYRYTVCGEGYLAQNSQYEFVGVGSATTIDYIKVTWNATGQEETIDNVQVNQAFTITESTGILSTSRSEFTNLSLYPNPSNNGVYRLSLPEVENLTAEVFDLSGRQVLPNTNIDQVLDISSLLHGIYFARIQMANGSKTFKLVYQ